jgi:hypothetical protein
MKNRKDEAEGFLDILLRGSGPSLELLGAFALGLIMIGILSNLAYDLLVLPGSVLPVFWQPLAASLILIVAAYLLFWIDQRRWRAVAVKVDESRLAPAHAGLIWLLGPRIEHLLFALEYHYQRDGARHCWVVMERNAPSIQNAYDQLTDEILKNEWDIQAHPVYIAHLDAKSAYEAVHTIFVREAEEEGLSPGQVIADITSGTKPLTAGMLLAAITVNGNLEYIESERDDKGQVIEGSQQVVLVDTQFYLIVEKEE